MTRRALRGDGLVLVQTKVLGCDFTECRAAAVFKSIDSSRDEFGSRRPDVRPRQARALIATRDATLGLVEMNESMDEIRERTELQVALEIVAALFRIYDDDGFARELALSGVQALLGRHVVQNGANFLPTRVLMNRHDGGLAI
jgi:hypothetical protein